MKPGRWGSPFLQEKYQGEKRLVIGDNVIIIRMMMMMMMVIIIIIIIIIINVTFYGGNMVCRINITSQVTLGV